MDNVESVDLWRKREVEEVQRYQIMFQQTDGVTGARLSHRLDQWTSGAVSWIIEIIMLLLTSHK